MYELLLPYGVKELVRTGRIAMSRGGGSVSVNGSGGPTAGTHERYKSAGEGKPQVGSQF